MVVCESSEFGYKNGIYAGNLFITKDGQFKQRDWNIRRGGRSSPETLTIFGLPNYETKIILHLSDFGLDGKMTKLELFRIHTRICECLAQDYGMYIFSSGYSYCCKDNDNGDFLKFNVLVHPKWLVTIDRHGQKQKLARDEHRNKVTEFVRDTATKILRQTIM
ncbi:unnamed protein product [Rotaria sordida]|uniref:Uncharacterized protein n=1 Tax=Rotaria sordida TaxID=392033 RepID=A0A814SWT1_9BILA|nr:unnamed protein product [Rotaria sordida]CAF1144313.1 unnamed protein product [Rotaria sordida]CAF1150219.1 unnamed protein product [Rotaria sordida]CAF3758388.1 unnamed protein product [Rotaria sordida]